MNKICRPKRTAISIAIAAAIASGWTASYAGTTNGNPNLGDGAIATGNGSRAVGDYSVAIGTGEQALGQNALAIGAGGTAADVNAIALGTAAVAQANAVAVGTSASAVATAIALGANSSATALAALALGQGAGAVNAGDVAIGAGSVTAAARAVPRVTVAGRTYDLAGSAPASVVSLGTVGAERQLTNVAAGAVSAASTDAVNGSELYAAYQAIDATSTYAMSLSTSTGQSVASLSTGVAANGAAVTALSTSLAAGTVGLVQQAGGAPGVGTITIGATTGGTAVDVRGMAGARQIKGVAGGSDATDAVNVQQLQQLATTVGAIGANAVVYDDASHARVTFGTPAAGGPVVLTNVADAALTAASTDAVAGRQLYATNQAVAGNAAAIGSLSTSTGESVASLSTGVAANGSALTTLSTSLVAGMIGLVQQTGGAPGAGTITIGATTGGTAVDVRGTAGARQIKGVAGGSDATDAVNVQQLQQLATTVGAIGANAVVYDDASHARVTLGTPAASTPVALTNVADAVLTSASTDAVSGRQLYATNQTLASLATGMAAGTVGLVQQAGGAPGAGVITIGAATGGTTVDVSGIDGARRITGVAAGRDATDAVNVAQLNQVAGAVNAVASNAVSYDDPARVSVTLGGLHATSTVLLRNVASGGLSATSTDAVNGAQLFATNQAVQANTNAITELASHVGRIQASAPSLPAQNPQGNPKYVSVNSSGMAAAASGTEAVAVGGNTRASGTGSTAIGSGAHVSGNGSVAIGSNATAPANNAVALGPGTVAERDNTVSFGNAATGLTRTLSNVSAGVAPTDAVNVQQLNDSLGSVRNQIEHDRRDANGGTASAVAIASLPQAPSPGTSVVAIGGGSYAGQSAMAVGLSTYAGRWIFKASGSTNTRGTVAAGVGAGYAW
ncbi:YadA-like family protein [Burkholderia stagnalis]|uniref:YadA-like family protein n=1 Tax=Burkholderia stagnalis TaxID=1503054 RepID=UPI0009BF7ECC|nr:YadA-like family protein [Burkholderia stagnalis]